MQERGRFAGGGDTSYVKNGRGACLYPSGNTAPVKNTILQTPPFSPAPCRVLTSNPSAAFEPTNPPAECSTSTTVFPSVSTKPAMAERTAAMSSFMLGLPGDEVPVLGRVAVWVG